MFIVIGIMIAGIIAGYLLRNRKRVFVCVGKLNMGIVCLLLFAMGLSVGGNSEIMDNLGGLGLQAILISFCATSGSIACAYFLYKYIFRDNRGNEA